MEQDMRATQEDHLGVQEEGRRGLPLGWLFAAGLALLALGYFWPEGDSDQDEQEQPVPVAEQPVTPAPAPPATVIEQLPSEQVVPAEVGQQTVTAAEEELATAEGFTEEPEFADAPDLPSEEESNAMLLAAVGDIGVAQPQQLLVRDTPLPDSAALIDAMGRGYLLRRLLGVEVNGSFEVEERNGQVYMAPNGFRRYDTLVQSLTALDLDKAVQHFHELRPLYQRAFGQLGMDPADFDDAVIRALDQVLSTPIIEEPIALEQESVMYTYADPQLQGMNGIQKHLLRMGPDNIRQLQAAAQSLRDALESGE